MRARAAAMQTRDIPIQIRPCAIPRMKVAGSGLPSAKAQMSSAVYTVEWMNDTTSRRPNVTTRVNQFARINSR